MPQAGIMNAVRATRPGSGVRAASSRPRIAQHTAFREGVGLAQSLNGPTGQSGNLPVQQATQGASVPPWEADPLAIGAIGAANQRYSNELGYLGSSQQALEQRYGYGPNAGANPYSLAAQLQRRHEAERRGTLNSAGLNIYSGSTVNRLNQADYRFSRDQTAQKQAFDEGVAKFERERQEASERLGAETREAEEGAIGRAEKEPLPAVPSAGKGKPSAKQQKIGVSQNRKAR